MGKEIVNTFENHQNSNNLNSPCNDGKHLTKEDKEKLKKRNRKARQKENRKTRKINPIFDVNSIENPDSDAIEPNSNSKDIEIEYVERDEYLLTGKYYEEFKNVFQYFATPNIEKSDTKAGYDENYSDNEEKDENIYNLDSNEAKETIKKNKEVKLSRKKRKQLKMLKVAQLKALVKRPDVVEVLVFLKIKYLHQN